jgi:hypothetical protein
MAIINSAPAIESIHLLWGLMWPDTFRAQVLFHLREKFPQYHRRSHNSLLIATSKGQGLHLTDEERKSWPEQRWKPMPWVTFGSIPTISCSGSCANLIARLPSN